MSYKPPRLVCSLCRAQVELGALTLELMDGPHRRKVGLYCSPRCRDAVQITLTLRAHGEDVLADRLLAALRREAAAA